MRPDYDADDTVRHMRRIGWGGALLILLGIVLALGWKIAQVSERRAMDATREHLVASLNSLTAEQMAKNQVLNETWRKKNPFVLLRWQQDNYCGELSADDEPQTGCWYWLPTKAWVLYRARFVDEWAAGRGEMQAWRLLAVPDGMSVTSQSADAAFALELEAVPMTELSALGLLSH